jgi:hypothetical protein
MKKFFVLLIISLFLSLSFIPSYADPIKESNHTFSYVTQILSNELFPEIKEYAKNNFDASLSDQNKFATEILGIMKKYVVAKKIFFSYPPLVKVFIQENNLKKVYILQIKVVIHDGGESKPYIQMGILIGKRFIIATIDKTKTKMGI